MTKLENILNQALSELIKKEENTICKCTCGAYHRIGYKCHKGGKEIKK